MANLQLHGDMTIGEAAAMRERLLGALPLQGGDLSIDLGQVQACDSAGIQLLLATHRLAAGRGTSLALEQVPACIAQALATYGLSVGTLQLIGQPA